MKGNAAVEPQSARQSVFNKGVIMLYEVCSANMPYPNSVHGNRNINDEIDGCGRPAKASGWRL